MKAIIYNRHSQDSGTGVSEEIQDPQMLDLVERAGGTVVATLPSDDWSSWTLDRPSFKKARAMLNAGEADTLVVPKLNRVTRRRWHWEELLNEMDESGWTVVPLDFPGIDLKTPMGRMMAGYIIDMGEVEYRDKAKGMNEARGNAVLTHGVHGGCAPPWGFSGWSERGTSKNGKVLRGPLVPAPDNRVREAFEAIAEGISHYAFRRRFGIRMAIVVSNRAYLGEARSGDYVKPNAHPALVDEELFRRANRRFEKIPESARRGGARSGPQAMLAGILRCASCGRALTRQRASSGKGDSYRHPWDTDCDQRTWISCAKVEPLVLARVLEWHERDTVLHVAHEDDGALTSAESALANAIGERNAIEADETLKPHRKATALSEADKAVEVAEGVLASLELGLGWRRVPHARVLEKVADDVEAQRSLISEYAYVTVRPGTKYTPVEERVEILRRSAVPVITETVSPEECARRAVEFDARIAKEVEEYNRTVGA